MNFFNSYQFKELLQDVIRETLQPLEEKIEEQKKLLEKVIIDKAEKEEEAAPVKDGDPPCPSYVFCGETQGIFETMKHQNITTSFVVSPLSINLGWFPFYNKADAETRQRLRKQVFLDKTDQRSMEDYFFDLYGLTWSSDVEALKKEKNFTGETSKLSFTINSYFSRQNRNNESVSSIFHTSPNTTRTQEFITWEPNKHNYHEADNLEIVRLTMEGNVLLHVFLPKKYFDAEAFMNKFLPRNIFVPFFSTQTRCVKITLPVFSINFKTEIKNILGEYELNEESFEHEAVFQLDKYGVNVSDVPPEDGLSEPTEFFAKEKPIEFLANRPFLFMLTKATHIMYFGWFQ